MAFRMPGVHGGKEDLATTIGNARSELEKVAEVLKRIDASMASISAKKIPAVGTPGIPKGGGSLMPTSQAALPSGAQPFGSPGEMTAPGNVSFGMMPRWALGMLGLARVAGIGALGVGALAWSALPDTESAVAMQYGLHQMGTRQNQYLGKPTQTSLLNTIMGSIDQYAVGGRDQPLMAGMTLSGAGIQDQGMLRRLLSQNQGISLMTGMPNSSVAQAQAGFSTGPFAARALSFGIPVASIGTGNMKGTGQILETMYNRMAVRENRATPKLIQESFLRGALGANFRALGMTDEQQQIALQYFTERSRSNGPVNLSDIKGLKKMGYNEDNNALMSEWSKTRSQLELMNKTFDSMAEGSKKANKFLKGMYDWMANLPEDKLRQTAEAKAMLDTAFSDPAFATGVGVVTSLMGSIKDLLVMLIGYKAVSTLLGAAKGAPPGAASGLAKGAATAAKGPLGLLALPVTAATMAYQQYQNVKSGKPYFPVTPGPVNPLSVQNSGKEGPKEGDAGLRAIKQWWHNVWDDSVARSLITGGAAPVQNRFNNPSGNYRASGSHWKAGHRGVDYPAPAGAPVYAAQPGRVVPPGSDTGWGGPDTVKIKGDDGHFYVYAHLNSNRVQVGDVVSSGQMIGKVGAKGNTTGPHLHFEVRTGRNYGTDVNPVPYTRGRPGEKSAQTSQNSGGASGAALVNYAKKFIGTPYVAGGRDPKGWDCAGFTWYVARHFGIEIGQISEAQLKKGSKVDGVKNAKPGDLFVWRKKGTRGDGANGHVAMYVGGGRVIHAHGGAGGTTNITSLAAAVPSSHYLAGIRRIAGGGPGVGPALTSQVGAGTPEALGTEPGGAVSGGLLDVEVSHSGMTVTTRTISESFEMGGPSSEKAATGTGNGTVSQIARSSRNVGVGAKVGGSSNQAKVWNMLMDKGFSTGAAAGIIGNLQQESGTNPLSNQHGGGPGRGIMQWTVNERWASLQNWAKKRDMKPRDLETQVEFMLKEMKDYGVYNKMRGIDNWKEATVFFQEKMERAGVPAYANRYKYAREALKQFGRGGYSEGAYRIPADEDARVHAGEMILTAQQAAQVRKEAASILTGSRGGGHTFHINVPPGTTEEQAQMIARRVASILDNQSTTNTLMEV